MSPFGIWRPGYPENVTGFDAYNELYADARKWLREGWVDYFTPQIYYRMSQHGQPYPIMLRWWIEQNVMARHIWPGNFTSRVAGRGRYGCGTAFERSDALLQHVSRRVVDAAVYVAELLQPEQPGGVIGVIERVSRSLMDGHCK